MYLTRAGVVDGSNRRSNSGTGRTNIVYQHDLGGRDASLPHKCSRHILLPLHPIEFGLGGGLPHPYELL